MQSCWTGLESTASAGRVDLQHLARPTDYSDRIAVVAGADPRGSSAGRRWLPGEWGTCSSRPSRTSTTCSGKRRAAPRELDYTEQTSWLLFLKYLDGLEQDRADQAALEGRTYAYILDEPYRWDAWAAPKDAGGQLDYNPAMTGDDLRDFVNGQLFPYLHGFKQQASGPNTIEYKIGEIFGEIKNKIQSGYNMREIIDQIDALRFRSQAEKHELSHLYEAKIRNMGNAGRNGGEYYTPRPLIRAMVRSPTRRSARPSTTAPSARPASSARPTTTCKAQQPRPHHRRRTAPSRSAPSTARRRSRSPT